MFGPIASGGMATVHFGRLIGEGGFGRIVAIKRLREQFAQSEEILRSLIDEARLVSRIQHPNVVGCLDTVQVDGEVFVVMEYVAGESLARLAETIAAPIPPAIACALVSGMLHGLQAAHEAVSERGEQLCIVHRDVSPQNVIVGRDGHPRLLDFGVAKARNRLSSTTEAGLLKGKLAYMSPEQVAGQPVDHRTDIFAAGTVLWELLTGRRLFLGSNEAQTILNVANGPIPKLREVAPQLSPELETVLLRALARNPAQRLQSAREFAQWLERVQPFATPTQIGSWVEGLAGPSLHAKAQLVARIEQANAGLPAAALGAGQPDPEEVSSANVTGPSRRESLRRWPAGLLLLTAGAAIATVVSLAANSLRAPPAAPPIVVQAASARATIPSGAAPLEPSPRVEPVDQPTQVATQTATPSAVASANPKPTAQAPRREPTATASGSATDTPSPVACEKRLGADGLWRLEPQGCTE
jgi:serine/threonine-protein kinase